LSNFYGLPGRAGGSPDWTRKVDLVKSEDERHDTGSMAKGS